MLDFEVTNETQFEQAHPPLRRSAARIRSSAVGFTQADAGGEGREGISQGPSSR